MGVLAHGRAQLSMNITDFQTTPISQVFRAVSALALKHKAAPVQGEVIGLIPEAAFERESDWVRQLTEVDSQAKILEHRLEYPLDWPGIGAGASHEWPAGRA
jgi:glutamate formiminotransferase